MKRGATVRFSALLCAALLCLPGMRAAGDPGTESQAVQGWVDCDACGEGGIPERREGAAEVRDGVPGVWVIYACPACGEPFAHIPPAWEERPGSAPENPAAPPENPVTVPEDPATPPENPVTVPENPVTPPEDPAVPPENPVTPPENPVTPPESPVTPPENPATPPESPVTLPENPAAPPENPALPELPPVPEAPAPEAPAPGPEAPPPESAPAAPPEGAGWSRPGRDYARFPVFSAVYPSRRLNLAGDPEAEAPVPGPRTWPEPETSSPLLRVTEGAGGNGSD